jgi:hypothetical protein
MAKNKTNGRSILQVIPETVKVTYRAGRLLWGREREDRVVLFAPHFAVNRWLPPNPCATEPRRSHNGNNAAVISYKYLSGRTSDPCASAPACR